MAEHIQNPHQSVDEAARDFMRQRHAIVSQESGPVDPLKNTGLALIQNLLGLNPYQELAPFARQTLQEASQSPEEQSVPRRFVTGSGANIRAEASTKGSDIGDIFGELEVIGPDVIGETYGGSNVWYQVRFGENQLGFVHSSVVSEPRVEDRPIVGPEQLTHIEFPDAATDLIDGGTWNYNGQEVSIRVYTNLDTYAEKRTKILTIDDAGWEIIGRYYNERFDQIAALPNQTLELPVYEQNSGWPPNMRAADVDENGAFQLNDERGQFHPTALSTILDKGINFVLVHQTPEFNIADEPPSASRGQIYYVHDGLNGREASFSYKFEHNQDEGLTIYLYYGKGLYSYSGPELQLRYFTAMLFPAGVLWDTANIQADAITRWGDNVTRTRNHIMNKSWGNRQNGHQPWSELLVQHPVVDDWKKEGAPHVVVQPF